MQLGLSENALSFYQTVLKFDPEQERARKQYRGLKKVVKLMGKAEEQVRMIILIENIRASNVSSFRFFSRCFVFSVFLLLDTKRLQQGRIRFRRRLPIRHAWS